VAVCSHDLSDEQVKILIGLDVEVVIAYDKGVKLEHIWGQCEKFYGVRKVSYIWDEFNVLKDKEAPADAKDKVYKFLFNRRITYDSQHHLKYMKYLEERDGRKKNTS
jgi:DNA primase